MLLRFWNSLPPCPHRLHERGRLLALGRVCGRSRCSATVLLVVWTVFPFGWILLTSLKEPRDMLAVPPKLVFQPTLANYEALFLGKQRGGTPRPGRTSRASSSTAC